MWISGRARRAAAERDRSAALGTVTLEQEPVGVYADGERRELPVFGPGGYRWSPRMGEQVLVLKTGDEGELPCVAGVRSEHGSLGPGEVEVSAGAASVRLSPDGTVTLKGKVKVNDMTLEAFCRANSGGTGIGEAGVK
ncbi:MAG: hypothetical protein EOM52_04870 [Clostridia bacterium]|nr:hypothetical protein [Clostridia bacterium]